MLYGNTEETIPLQSISTATAEVTTTCFENNQEAARNIDKRGSFTYSGNFESSVIDVQQQCFDHCEDFTESGCADWDFTQHSENIGADCECRPIQGSNRARLDTNCDCDCVDNQREKDNKVDDPDRDIENRVSKQVERAIADILSDVVNRCISSSLKDCINWDE